MRFNTLPQWGALGLLVTATVSAGAQPVPDPAGSSAPVSQTGETSGGTVVAPDTSSTSGLTSTTPAPEQSQTPSPSDASSPQPGSEATQETPGPSYGTRHPLILDQIPQQYESVKTSTFSFSAGSHWFSEGQMAEVFQPYTSTLRLQIGRQRHDQFQWQLEAGMVKDTGNSLGVSSGNDSGDEVTLKLFPLGLSATYRFDYRYEQMFVPFVSVGGSLLLTSLESNDGTEVETNFGHRMGYCFGGGVELLLDVFEPSRAADLELASGINDTYLVLDVRKTRTEWYVENGQLVLDTSSDTSNVLLTGVEVTAGLKFDF